MNDFRKILLALGLIAASIAAFQTNPTASANSKKAPTAPQPAVVAGSDPIPVCPPFCGDPAPNQGGGGN